MKKKFAALLCSIALTLSLLVLPSSAAGGLFFLSLNDTLPANSAQTTPIQYNGWVYVPVSVFNNRVTGINFGVYYGFTDNNESLIFYNLAGKTLTFNLQTGTASAVGGETPVPGTIVRQNGVYYAPAYALCRYFGLSYSFYTTEYGPLLRIKDGNAVLGDPLFMSSAASLMRGRLQQYNQSQNGGSNTGGSTTRPTPPATPVKPIVPVNPNAPIVPDPVESAPVFSLYLGLRASAGTDITPSLNALANIRASAVVFFPAEDLLRCTDQIRQAAARGHKVGLIPAGDSSEARLKSVAEGSKILAKVLRQETWFVLGSDAELTKAGYLCWSPTLTAASSGSSTELYNAVLGTAAGRSEESRVLLDSRTPGGVLAGVLNQLSADGDTFHAPRETKY